MAGGIPYQGIDFSGIVNAYFASRDAAERRNAEQQAAAAQRDQMKWERDRIARQDSLAEKERADQAAQRKQLFDAIGLAHKGDTSQLEMINPDLAMKYIDRSSQQTNSRRTATANVMRQLSTMPDGPQRAQMLDYVNRNSQGPNALFEPISQPGPDISPDALAGLGAQADAVLGPAKLTSDEEKLVSEGLKPGTPEAHARARYLHNKSGGTTTVNVGAGSQGIPEGQRGKLIEAIDQGESTLARIEDLDQYDPREILTLQAKAKANGLSLRDTLNLPADVPFIGGLSDDERAQLQRYTDFTQTTKDLMLEARRALTGTGGGEREMGEIEKSLLSENLSPEQYGAAKERLRQKVGLAVAIKRDMLRHGINVEDQNYYPELRKRWREANSQIKSPPPGGAPRPPPDGFMPAQAGGN